MKNNIDLNDFYDKLNRYYDIDRSEFINVKIDNVIDYASEEAYYGNVVDMTSQNNSYLPFSKCLIYGKRKEDNIMVYFIAQKIKKENADKITVGELMQIAGKKLTENEYQDHPLQHGKAGVQIVDMFINMGNDNLHYLGGMIETFSSDYKRSGSIIFEDKDSPLRLSSDERKSIFVYYLTALEFFHCKNVKIVNNPIPEKLKKAQIKRSGKAKLESSTIKVYPYIFSKDEEKKKISFDSFTGDGTAHYTRGHFRTYKEEAKLFGRFTGTFFISPHFRGKTEGGKFKDYELIAENKEKNKSE